MNIKNRFKQINWKRGAAELLGYAIVLPMIVIMVIAILSAGQITNANQSLAYSAYSVCRAAVVSSNEESAVKRANSIMEEIYGGNYIGGEILKPGSPYRPGELENGEVCYEIEYIGDNATWIKGDIIKCTIYQRITPVMPFTDSVYSQAVVMMIENGGTYIGGSVVDDASGD